MRAALYVSGRIVVGDSHLACFQKLSECEQNADMDSGFYDQETGQFISEREREVFDKKELYLVRHGKATCPEDPDPDISAEGECQAHQAGVCLYRSEHDLKKFVCYVSPLLRCLRTASIIQKILGVNFQIMPEVMETPHFLNDGEIFKIKNRSCMFPQFDWPTSKEWHVLPETAIDFHDRVKETLQHFPSHSIVVTHYGYICLTAKMALCKSLLNEGFPPASVTYFHGQDGYSLLH